MEGRKQFTCYRSYYEAISKIKKAADRAKAYDILMEYALNGVEPDADALPVAVSIAFLLIKPTLDTGRHKAENGKKGGSKPQANAKQTVSKKEKEKEVEIENEIEIEKESFDPLTPFERFWQAYPRKDRREEAACVFEKLGVSPERLLQALEQQKQQPQWQMEAGRYIPTAAKWLERQPWLQTQTEPAMDPMMQAAIRRMMTGDHF